MSANKGLNPNSILKLIPRCPVCKTKYTINDFALVYEKEHGHLFHFTCQQCKNKILAYVLENMLGVTTIALLTDLYQDEVIKFLKMEVIDDDYFIDFYNRYNDNPEAFTKLISSINLNKKV